MSHVKKAAFLVAAIVAAGLSGEASASITESATLTPTAIAGGYQYNIALTNTSTDGSTIGLFWFAWIPGMDYMERLPTTLTSPSGWSCYLRGAAIDQSTLSYGNSIEWVANSSATLLTPGNTATFSFDSAASPVQLMGPSSYGNQAIETTSVIYPGTSTYSSPAVTFVVPEPASGGLIALCCGGMLRRRRRAD